MSGARLGLVLAEGAVTHKDHQSPLNQYQYQVVCVFPEIIEVFVLIHSRAGLTWRSRRVAPSAESYLAAIRFFPCLLLLEERVLIQPISGYRDEIPRSFGSEDGGA